MKVAFSILLIVCSGFAQENRWAFEPKQDDFSPNALLDLRSLNEKVAGENGFIQASPEGDFLDGKGNPIRFWAMNTSVYEPLPQYSDHPKRDLARHARWLAKRGVNMVRWHGSMIPKEGKSISNDPFAINREALDGVWRLVAAMKHEGIYTTVSPYWAVPMKVPATWGIEGPDKMDGHGLLFFHPKMQAAYKAWLKALFTEKNPHTGIPLAQDPAVAIIQIQNEDSLLFWTFENINKEQQRILGKQFGDYLKKKYGSLEKAQAAWANATVKESDKKKGDDAANGTFGFYPTWEFTSQASKPSGGRAVRMADQLEFLTETMRSFNQSIVDYLRKELGCKQLVNAGNWKPADAVLLNDAERYSYTSTDVIGVNRYFAALHKGPNEGWAVMAGDKFQNLSIFEEPRELAVNLKQVQGKPMIISESSWVTPNNYQSEGAFLTSVYSSLNGVDIFYWFATGATEWMPVASANGFMKNTRGKWLVATPEQLGQFPAAALLFRKGYVKRGEPVVVEHRPLESMWKRERPLVTEDAGFDPNRDKGDSMARSGKTSVDPLAFLVGPVQVVYGSDATKTKVADLSKHIEKDLVRSNTGEVEFDRAKRIALLNAPAAQGVSGFLKGAGGKFTMGDVQLESGNDYATVMVVSMDEKPLKSASRVLVQIGTQSRPTGWKDKPVQTTKDKKPINALEVVDLGKSPWSVVNTDLTLTLNNPQLKKAMLLDINGNAVSDIPVQTSGGKLRVTLPPNSMYVVLQ